MSERTLMAMLCVESVFVAVAILYTPDWYGYLAVLMGFIYVAITLYEEWVLDNDTNT